MRVPDADDDHLVWMLGVVAGGGGRWAGIFVMTFCEDHLVYL